ncbi:unnamed protein product [Prorocentrum cordatum]|nr:unnamed protein product [Polarella glacialis]
MRRHHFVAVGSEDNREGMLLRKSELSRGSVAALGAELDGEASMARVAPERIWAIHAALGALLRRKRVSAWSLQVVMGHCAFAALRRRGLFSAFHSVYAFIERGLALQVPEAMWGECRAELRVFRSRMIFATSDWQRRWNDLMIQTNSSLEGCAVAQASWPIRLRGRLAAPSNGSVFGAFGRTGPERAPSWRQDFAGRRTVAGRPRLAGPTRQSRDYRSRL